MLSDFEEKFHVKKCPPSSTYSTCGTACPLTCENYQNPPTICTRQCVIGCFCDSGYVRNANGQCVLPEECPQQQMCPPFSTYNECGTACPVTCENYSDSGISFNSCVDIDECVAGCFCNEGYVQYSIANNWCTKPNNCP